jgi:hypothetical protein
MPREKLDREEAERRNRECRRRYNETHRAELLEKQRLARMADPEAYRAKKREDYHATIDKLIEAGVYTPLKPGRKRLYTPEEAAEVAKRQRQESYLRRQERLNVAKALLAQEGVEQ